jgi:hypothetical protein
MGERASTVGGATKRIEQAVFILAIFCALTAVLFVANAFFRSPQNPVAAELQFEAFRVARDYKLYVDPWRGAFEDGSPPSRYYVLYTPLFPTLLGKLASPTLASVKLTGRIIALVGWIALFVPPVVWAPKDRRRATAIAAMLGAGVYFTARHAASMSPDTLAAALVCGGVLRAVYKDDLDPWAAIMIAAAPFVKPSCLGGAAGAGIALLVLRRPTWLRGLLAGVGSIVVLMGMMHLMSDGAWLTNIKNSTGQPLTLTRWFQEMGSRVMVLGIPQFVVLWVAWKRKASWFIVGPLLGSLLWTTFMMAKHGSGAHYWFEPTVLAVIAVSRMPGAAERWFAPAALALGVVVAATSWPNFLAEPARYRVHDANIAALREHCVRRPGEFILSSDYDAEMELNGHISVPAWQSAFLARIGKFPKEAWQHDLVRPEVAWVAIAVDPRAPPGQTNDEQVELSPFYDILKEPLLATFDFDANVGGMFVFKRKPTP